MTTATDPTPAAAQTAAADDDPTVPIPVPPVEAPTGPAPTEAPGQPAAPAETPTKPAATEAPTAVIEAVDPEPTPRKKLKDRAAAAVTTWWGFVRQPMSLRQAWKLSGIVDPRRIPGESNLLATLWWWSNRTDRILLFAVLLILPTSLNGPVLWCAVRPTRRWGMYAVLFILLVLVPSMAGG